MTTDEKLVSAWIRQLMLREVQSLRAELALFPSDEAVWEVVPGITNPTGTLVLHLCGNLQSFIGAVLGGTGYVRDRPAEFSTRGTTRTQLDEELDRTAATVDRVLSALPDAALHLEYPDVFGGLRLPCGLFLQHLTVHLGFHIGQIGYLRRMLTGAAVSSGAIDMHALQQAALFQLRP